LLFNNDKKREAMEQFKQSEEIFKKLDEQDQEQEMLD
jgi:hypothetical protein